MFIVYKMEEYNAGHFIYDDNSLIGIYDNINIARNDLINYMSENKYISIAFEIKKNLDNYFLISTDVYSDEGGKLCYEIIEKKILINMILKN